MERKERMDRPEAGPRLPTIRFEADCKAPAEVVYGLLADLRSHVEWGGERAAKKSRLLSIEAPEGQAGVGTEFRSTGQDGPGRFADRSVVTEAIRPSVFEFVTEGRRSVKGKPSTELTIVHRYEIAQRPEGCHVVYTAQTTRMANGPGVLGVPVLGGLLWKAVATLAKKGFRGLLAMAEERAG